MYNRTITSLSITAVFLAVLSLIYSAHSAAPMDNSYNSYIRLSIGMGLTFIPGLALGVVLPLWSEIPILYVRAWAISILLIIGLVLWSAFETLAATSCLIAIVVFLILSHERRYS